jgi:hypothetical protein
MLESVNRIQKNARIGIRLASPESLSMSRV